MRIGLNVLAACTILTMAGCDSAGLFPTGMIVTTNDNATDIQLLVTSSATITTINSPVLISASVLQNGTPVSNGTSVTFTTNLGAFSDNNSSTILLRTTNGLVGASLASRTPGVATVTLSAGSSSQSVRIVFTDPTGAQLRKST